MSLSRFGSIRRRAAGVASAAGLLSFVAMGVPGLSADSVDFNNDGVGDACTGDNDGDGYDADSCGGSDCDDDGLDDQDEED